MNDQTAEIVRVRIEKSPDQWVVATCEEIPGLFISHPEIGKVIEDIPVTIKALYKAQYGVDVYVVIIGEVKADQLEEEMPFVAIPTEIIAQQSQQL